MIESLLVTALLVTLSLVFRALKAMQKLSGSTELSHKNDILAVAPLLEYRGANLSGPAN